MNTSVKKSAKRGPRAYWGQKGPPESQKAPEAHLDKSNLEVMLEAVGYVLGDHFLMFWGETYFSLLE